MMIYERMIAVLGDLPAIGKDRRNREQNFNYRGVDDVLDELNPLLAKHGVFFVPEVLDRETSQRVAKSGSTMWVVNLHVRYTFYGADGDSVTADGWGEGTDMGDKATQKAMTGAMKYVLFQTFAIATHEVDDDSDSTTPDETPVRIPAPKEITLPLRDRVKAAGRSEEVLAMYAWPWTADECGVIDAMIPPVSEKERPSPMVPEKRDKLTLDVKTERV